MLVVVGGLKGGGGKTTIATNLCQMRSRGGNKVLLIDGDEQKSAFEWSVQRDNHGHAIPSFQGDLGVFTTVCLTGKSIYSNLLKLMEDYDDIIVDTGGRDFTTQRAALMCADVFLVPFRPRSIDIWTIGSVANLVQQCVGNPKLVSYAFINQGDANGEDNESALEVIREHTDIECLPYIIRNRKSFANASANGLGVEEIRPVDKKAVREMREIYEWIYR